MRVSRKAGCAAIILAGVLMFLLRHKYQGGPDWASHLVVTVVVVGIVLLLVGWARILFDDPDDRR